MKSKSFDMPKNSPINKQNKTYDFVNYYKSAAESNVKLVEKRKFNDGSRKEDVTPKHEAKTRKKQYENIDISKINIDGDSVLCATEGSSLDDSKITSAPNVVKKDLKPIVKSIIKNKSVTDNSLEITNVNISNKMSKKRNKSVSFMLDDTEVVSMKRSKSEETVSNVENPSTKVISKIKNAKKSKKKMQVEKKNNHELRNMAVGILATENIPTTSKVNINNNIESTQTLQISDNVNQTKEKSKKVKSSIPKKGKTSILQTENLDCILKDGRESVVKKINKNKKHHIQSDGTDGEPAQKSSKKDVKPDIIAQGLENLNIGDNAHTLTSLLDEMSVVDKNKKKRNKAKKQKRDKPISASSNADGIDSKVGNDRRQRIEDIAVETTNNEEQVAKEKVKWVKRKWNKDKKGDINVDKHLTLVIIENLPLNIVFTYKKLLAERFEKFGMIKQVGIAEMYPTEEPKPVFTTTINFYSEDAAKKALEEDESVVGGGRVRVRRAPPPALSTLVVRGYGALTEQALSSAFAAAGRLRSIRPLVKGRNSLSTTFIEFDGPKSVERAIKMAEGIKIGGKKIHVAKFEVRAKKLKQQDKTEEDNENSDDSS